MTKKLYIWYHDRKTVGILILFIAIAFQIFAFLKVPGLTTLHGYTVGMMIGAYNPFFYFFICYIGMILAFDGKLKLPKWLKISGTSYWIAVVAIIFVGVATSFYQGATDYTSFGAKPWSAFNKWYGDFTSEHNGWLPANTNGGVLGAFLYSIVATVLSGTGALVISILFIMSILAYIGFWTWIAFRDGYKPKKTRQKNLAPPKAKALVAKTKGQAENKRAQDEPTKEVTKRNGNETILPFNDPFSESEK